MRTAATARTIRPASAIVPNHAPRGSFQLGCRNSLLASLGTHLLAPTRVARSKSGSNSRSFTKKTVTVVGVRTQAGLWPQSVADHCEAVSVAPCAAAIAAWPRRMSLITLSFVMDADGGSIARERRSISSSPLRVFTSPRSVTVPVRAQVRYCQARVFSGKWMSAALGVLAGLGSRFSYWLFSPCCRVTRRFPQALTKFSRGPSRATPPITRVLEI